MRSIHKWFMAAALLAGGCGGEQLGVNVECEAKTREAVTCDVKQTAGKSEMDVCWDLTATCPNGEKVTAPRTCQKVKGGATEQATILRSSLTNVDNCQGGKPTMQLANLTINGKKAQ